jgi:kynureninase
MRPHHVEDAAFFEAPVRIRTSLAKLIGAKPEAIAHTTGASTGGAAVASTVMDHQPAIISISTSAPNGSAATATVVRAGYGATKCLAYTSFISVNRFMSMR